MNQHSKLNYIGIIVISSIILIAGTSGFLLPDTGLTSTSTFYNIFHIVFGLVGFGILMWGNDRAVKLFNLSFGLIDLYQFFASEFNMFPQKYFLWKPTDDYLHLFIGTALVILGYIGLTKNLRPIPTQD